MKFTNNLARGMYTLMCILITSTFLISQCDTNCSVNCIGQINVSLDRSCTAEITPAMGGIGIDPTCNSAYEIELYDSYGNLIPDDIVGIEQNGELITFKIIENQCGNACWGNALIEYKYPPLLECPEDLTLACGALDLLGMPPVTAGCADFEIQIINQQIEDLHCDPLYTKRVTRTYRAEDTFGNYIECSHNVYIERIDLDGVIFPPNAVVSCTDNPDRFDENGIPLPWYTLPLTGSGSGCGPYTGSGTAGGIPIICDPNLANGLLCHTTNDQTGIPLIPQGGAVVIIENCDPNNPVQLVEPIDNSNNASLCNAILTYTDIEFPNIPCKRKILRTWEVREWWCTGESIVSGAQFIEIVDDAAPELICPADFTVTTDQNCAGSVFMDAIDYYDNCGENISVMIQHANGFIHGNGGYGNLNMGENQVTYIVSDECNNQATCHVNVTVRDNTPPVAICETFKVVSLSQTDYTIVYAEPFDNGSWDECGPIDIAVRRMDTLCVPADTLFGESVAFCCADVMDEVMVVFRVTDQAGNFNECMVRVDVQDKIAPSITCPPDQTIDCRDGYDLNNLGLFFGNANIQDNCSSTQITREIVEDDVNQCGIGYILRQIEIIDEDSLALASCKQNITITNTAPFQGSSIQWPLDLTLTDMCILDELDPEDLEPPYDFPSFGETGDCALLGYDYDDKYFQPIAGSSGCGYIERTWKVINWCGETNGTFDQWVSPTPQRIELINNTAPVLTPVDSILVESQNINCQGDTITIERMATDDCSHLIWNYRILDENGVLVYEADSNALVRALDVGEYDVYWTVRDGCGNADSDVQHITVINTKAPSPVCINGLSATLIGMDLDNDGVIDAEMVELWASDFDSGSSHSCGNPFVFSVSSDTTIRNIIFDCNDIGVQEVQLWVTDVITGYQDFCRSYIEIQDNNNVDICDTTQNRVLVEGEVFTEELESISKVHVSLQEDAIYALTDVDGTYAFPNMPMGNSYEIRPKKDDDHLNGVSTLDLVYMQRHILGIERFNSPYQYIAGDINNDNAISAIDLIELRKLVLGIYEELPENESWRFVDTKYEFINTEAPLAEIWPETYLIEKLDQNMKVDFIGMKVGDVNNSVSTKVNGDEIDIRRNAHLLNTKMRSLSNNDRVFEILNTEDINIDGFQLSLNLPDNLREIKAIRSDIIGFDFDKHVFLDFNNNKLNISFHVLEDIDIKSGDVLVYIDYSSIENESKDIWTLNHQQLSAQIYSNRNVINFDLQQVEIEDLNVLVSPNPWTDFTTVHIISDNYNTGELEIFDVTGSKLYAQRIKLSPGNNTISLSSDMFTRISGVMYVRIKTNEHSVDAKMIKLN